MFSFSPDSLPRSMRALAVFVRFPSPSFVRVSPILRLHRSFHFRPLSLSHSHVVPVRSLLFSLTRSSFVFVFSLSPLLAFSSFCPHRSSRHLVSLVLASALSAAYVTNKSCVCTKRYVLPPFTTSALHRLIAK